MGEIYLVSHFYVFFSLFLFIFSISGMVPFVMLIPMDMVEGVLVAMDTAERVVVAKDG
jgi:hypothetical protein